MPPATRRTAPGSTAAPAAAVTRRPGQDGGFTVEQGPGRVCVCAEAGRVQLRAGVTGGLWQITVPLSPEVAAQLAGALARAAVRAGSTATAPAGSVGDR